MAPLEDPMDADLNRKLRGSPLEREQAFHDVYERDGRWLQRYLCERIDALTAEEIRQDTFMKWRRNPGNGRYPIRAVLRRTATSLLIDRYRRRAARPEGPLDSWKDVEGVFRGLSVLHNFERPEDALDVTSRTESLSRAIAELPERQRECLLLRYFVGFESKEIATILSISRDAVYKNIQRAEDRLRRMLSEEVFRYG